MGNYTGAKIAENRQYENPSDPVNSNYSVIFEVTAPDAVIYPDTGKTLTVTLAEQAAGITTAQTAAEAARTAAEAASNAVEKFAEHNHDDRYYTETEIDSKLSGKADAAHTHTASQITDLPASLPANGGNADTVNGYTVLSNVPANAKFTDTTYGYASASASGLVSTGDQTFAGNKTFNGSISATGNITGANVYNAVWNADYAEGFDYEGDIPELGKIVELCGSNKVRTAAAGSDMVIGVCSDTYWALAGCSIEDIKRGVKVAVGIAGRLPIKVRGAVKYGDYIVCGGDGIGEARSKPSDGQVVGRAMESSASPEIKDVNCIIQIR